MNAGAKLAALNKFRATPAIMCPTATKVLVVYDVQVKTPEVSQIPLVINYGALSSHLLLDTILCIPHQICPKLSKNTRTGMAFPHETGI